MTSRKTKSGFSLVELVIVIVIIGIIAAIAVPRISRGAKGASDAALRSNLTILRNAIDLYAAEHNGKFPTAAKFTEQLTTFTDINGADSTTKDSTHFYGPYVKAVPALPVKGTSTTGGAIGDTGVDSADGAGIGWLYTESTGAIAPNTGTSEDDSGTEYKDY